MSKDYLPWVKKQIPEAARDNPEILIPKTLEDILARGGAIQDAHDVLAIQTALRQLGYNPGKLDGIFRNKHALKSKTMHALSQFQEANKLKQSGQPRKETIEKMLAQLTAKTTTKVIEKKDTEGPIVPASEITSSSNFTPIQYPKKGVIQQNIDGISAASSILVPGSNFLPQTIENIRGAFEKPRDVIDITRNSETAILIPGFLCNQGVMRQLGGSLSKSMNVIYPDIGALEQTYRSLPELADKITNYILDLEDRGLLPENGKYTIIGHSMGGSLALLVTKKLRAKHIIQISTPNRGPDVARISGLDYIPAISNLRNIETEYAKVKPISPIEKLTVIIPENDKFVGAHVQGAIWLPPSMTFNKLEGKVVKGGHIDPILTNSGIEQIVQTTMNH